MELKISEGRSNIFTLKGFVINYLGFWAYFESIQSFISNLLRLTITTKLYNIDPFFGFLKLGLFGSQVFIAGVR